MARKTHLDVSAWSVGGTDFIGLFKNASVDIEAMTQEGRAVSQRYGLAIPVKKNVSFSFDELITSSGGGAIRQSNLNITVFSIAGTSYLSTLDSGSLKITTVCKDGSADSDEWEFNYAMGTEYEVEAELFVATSATLLTAIAAAGISGLLVAVSISLGGSVISLPMTMTKGGHTTGEGDFQKQKVSLKGRGAPTTATGNSLVVSILTGTASIAYVLNTGANTYSGDAIVKESGFTWANSQLITASHAFAGSGAPTVS